MADEKKPAGPDLTRGVPFSSIADGGFLLGHVGGEAVLLVRQGAEAFAIGPECTHYHGPLAEGVVTDGAVRCPWHHACFDLRTGEALHAPALSPVACWKVERQGDTITVREKMEQPKPRPRGKASAIAGQHRHCRRWRGRICSGRDAAPAGLPERHHDAQQRRRAAGRSP